jgi:exodeoxyribonuclease VII large subunit
MTSPAGLPDAEKALSVSEITARIKELLEASFGSVLVVGEISNAKLHTSGHLYFTLKDESAQIRCVMFRSSAAHLEFTPEDGKKVYARGELTVYDRYGTYQIIVRDLVDAGKGDLQIAFNKLKNRLEKEGLFDPARKKPLPRFPQRIGIVTSPTGAAVRDIIRTARRIYPAVDLILYPVKVQGEGAREEIAAAVRDFNVYGGVDVIIVGRGGGSIEDLWAFNEEIVARAISASEIPVVSAVGHETDFTISDFVADVRVPTPTAAPSLILADYVEARTQLGLLVRHAARAVTAMIDRHRRFIESLRTRYGLRSISDRLAARMKAIEEALSKAKRAMEDRAEAEARRLADATSLAERLVSARLEAETARLRALGGRIDALSPLSTLGRGYSVVLRDDTSEVVSGFKQISAGDRLRLVFSTGGALCRVEKVQEVNAYEGHELRRRDEEDRGDRRRTRKGRTRS